ncbi:MAG TPA: asparagine synthase-related protein [Longimicrobiaceae bacterium]
MSRFVARLVAGEPPRLVADPGAVEAEGCLVLLRGYLGNRAELDAEARRRGHRPPACDAGRVALAFRWWGAELARHVVGEYAAAVYDPGARTLLLAHDELGLAPLFYAAGPGGVAFGTPLEDVVAETGVDGLDEEFIADYFAQGQHFGARTPYAAIRRLRAGESVVWRDGRDSRHDVRTLNGVRPLRCRDEREYADAVRERLEEGVAAALPEEGRAWCELSGGLDSSTVLGIAARLGAPGLAAVSMVYPLSHTADETKWMRVVLDEHPVPWHPVDADAVRPFTELPRSFFAEPNLWLPSCGLARTCRELFREHGVDVVLTGQGGDAVFHGDVPRPYFLADLLRRGRAAEAWRRARDWGAASDERRPPVYLLHRFGLRAALRHLRGRALDLPPVAVPWADQRYAAAVGLGERGRASPAPGGRTVEAAYHMERVMHNAAAAAVHFAHASTGAEYRHPLFHRPLVELMLSLPWEHKYRTDGDRPLQRLAMEGVLPRRTLRRRGKQGPDQATQEGLESGEAWIDLLTARPRIVERGYAAAGPWREAVQHARFGRTAGIRHFMSSANLEAWLQGLESFAPRSRLAAGLSAGAAAAAAV